MLATRPNRANKCRLASARPAKTPDMIQLYYDPACPFCARVLDFLAEQSIPFEQKQISLGGDSPTRQELIAMTGRSQVPFLVDPERDVRMHESMDIIDYIGQHYGK